MKKAQRKIKRKIRRKRKKINSLYILMTPFWINKPTILLNKNEITEIWPTSSMSRLERLNAMSRMIILLVVISYIGSRDVKFILIGALMLLLIILYYYYTKNKVSHVKEGFVSMEKPFTLPSNNNPLMNVLQTDYVDNPNRLPAAPASNPIITKDANNCVKNIIAKNFDDPDINKRLFEDLGDSKDLEDSMHNWYATANTQIPNDQKAFSKFCYGDTAYCKDNPCLCSHK